MSSACVKTKQALGIGMVLNSLRKRHLTGQDIKKETSEDTRTSLFTRFFKVNIRSTADCTSWLRFDTKYGAKSQSERK